MAQDPERSGPSGWLRIVLFGSLALNLGVIGVVAGVMLSGGFAPPGGPPGRDPVAPFTRAFTDVQRDDLRNNLRDALKGKNNQKWRRSDLQADYRQVLALLRSDPYDAAAMTRLLSQQTSKGEDRRKAGQEVLVAFLTELTLEERQIYADRLEEEMQKLFERRGKGQKRD